MLTKPKTPDEVWSWIQARDKPVVVGTLKMIPPLGRTRVRYGDDIDDTQELVPPQMIDIPGRGRVALVPRGTFSPGNHHLRNMYFSRLMKSGSSWEYFGESDDWTGLFRVAYPKLDCGTYVILGLVVGELEDVTFVAQDDYVLEVVESQA